MLFHFFPTANRDKEFPLSAVTFVINLIFLPKLVLAQHFPSQESLCYPPGCSRRCWGIVLTRCSLPTSPLAISNPVPRPLGSKQIYPKSYLSVSTASQVSPSFTCSGLFASTPGPSPSIGEGILEGDLGQSSYVTSSLCLKPPTALEITLTPSTRGSDDLWPFLKSRIPITKFTVSNINSRSFQFWILGTLRGCIC